MRIITLTLNPAYDMHCGISEFFAEKENTVESCSRSVGGKGINITRALLQNGVANTPLLILGEDNAAEFTRDMAAEGITEPIIMIVKGRIRENITVHPTSGKETRISFKGFSVASGMLDEVYDLITPKNGDVVTFTGSLPAGISSDEAESFLAKLKNDGVKLVIDSKSISLDALRRLKPWLIKPNDEEIAVYMGELDGDGIVNAARSLHGDGIENAIISLGSKGAILASSEGVFEAHPPKIEVLSTIGAGDSLIAGFIAAYGKTADERLRYGIAYGSAACMREGTNPPLAEDIAAIADKVEIRKIG